MGEQFFDIYATCRTSGCDNAGITIHLSTPEPDAATMCGVCGNRINDVSTEDPSEEVPTEVPAWLE